MKAETAKAYRRSSAWVVPFHRPTRSILIARRSKKVNNPGLWNLFGGNIEGSDSPLKTARKEFREEAGIKLPKEALISIGKTKSEVRGERFIMHYFVFEANHEFRPVLNDENSKAIWVPLDDIDEWMHSTKAHRSLRNFRYVLDGMIENRNKKIEKEEKSKKSKSGKDEETDKKPKGKGDSDG